MVQKVGENLAPGGFFFTRGSRHTQNLPAAILVDPFHCEHALTFYPAILPDVFLAGLYHQVWIAVFQGSLPPAG